MRKAFFYLLVVSAVVVLLARFGFPYLTDLLGYQPRAGLKVTSNPEATLAINGAAVGKTPYLDEKLRPGEYQVRLEENGALWEGVVKLSAGTLSVVNRDLAQNVASSAGEIVTLGPGSGVVISSNPAGADVEIDGQTYGQTPLAVPNLSPADHIFVLRHDHFLQREMKASIPAEMVLQIAVDLAVAETNVEGVRSPAVATSTTLKVGSTPTGFLRVRDRPSLSGAEIGRLSSGDTVTQIEELAGWVKVRLQNGTEGYVSSQYVQKQP